ncbi:hypothetical protein OG232_31635 [Streptomyces sp. NBC_01411]
MLTHTFLTVVRAEGHTRVPVSTALVPLSRNEIQQAAQRAHDAPSPLR